MRPEKRRHAGPAALAARLRTILADPFYRYEARRYWSPQRYAGTAAFMLGWWALLALLALAAERAGFVRADGLGPLAAWTLVFCVLGRVPLSVAAAAGAALCIAPEKAYGQLEQFVLTPIDPWRFCLARIGGRLRGVFWLWLAMGAVFAVGAAGVWAAQGAPGGVPGLLLLLIVVAATQLDCAGMILADAALGMHFSAKAHSPTVAMVQTLVVCFVVAPVAFTMIMFQVGGAVFVPMVSAGMGNAEALFWLLAVVLVRLGIAGVTARYFPDDARKSMEKAFYEPGEP
jgi:hypothetical protein